MQIRERLAGFFRARYPVEGLREAVGHKTVPVHRHSFWYYWGGVTLALILIQIVSGLLLLLYYRPTMDGAFESVKFIMTKVQFGWLVRSVHAWAANLVICSAFIHLMSTFFLKSYRAPRELTWVTGIALMGLLMGFGFTGYLLPWNVLSFFATKVGTEIAGSVPAAGPVMRTFLRGGADVGDPTLGRFFWLHTTILPLALFGLMGLHLAFIQLQGMSKPLSVRESRSMPFFPNFLLRDLVAWSIMLGIVLSVSVYWPATLGQKADPFAPTPAGIEPEWYFLWMFQTLKLFPSHVLGIEGELVAVLLTGFGGAVVLLVPWLDRSAARGERSRVVWAAGVLAIAYVVGMTIYARCAAGRH